MPKAKEPATDFSKNWALFIFLPTKEAQESEIARIIKAVKAIGLGKKVKVKTDEMDQEKLLKIQKTLKSKGQDTCMICLEAFNECNP
jgi:putative cell wall-binding protein